MRKRWASCWSSSGASSTCALCCIQTRSTPKVGEGLPLLPVGCRGPSGDTACKDQSRGSSPPPREPWRWGGGGCVPLRDSPCLSSSSSGCAFAQFCSQEDAQKCLQTAVNEAEVRSCGPVLGVLSCSSSFGMSSLLLLLAVGWRAGPGGPPPPGGPRSQPRGSPAAAEQEGEEAHGQPEPLPGAGRL